MSMLLPESDHQTSRNGTEKLGAIASSGLLPDTASEKLFPLPLSPFELFLILDEEADCPLTSFIELHFSSPMRRDVLQDALRHAVHQHPLLASRLIENDGQYLWDYDSEFVPELLDPSEVSILEIPVDALEEADQDFTAEGRPRRIDLFFQPGCRYWYEDRSGGESRLTIQLHHAASDGVGLRRMLIDTLSAYADVTTPPSMVDPERNSPKAIKRRKRDAPVAEKLADRADFSSITDKPAAEKISVWQKIRNAYYFHFQRPQSLEAAETTKTDSRAAVQPSSGSLNEPLRHHIFDEETSTCLLEYCRKNEVSINDLALTILFRACCHWNRQRGIDAPQTRVRLLMPFDLRSRSDLQMPATNRLSFAFLGRTHQQCESWPELLTSVQRETQSIKASRVYMDFLDGIAAYGKRPKWLRRILKLKASRNMSTSVLTYTGDIARGMKNYFPEVDGRRRIGDTFLDNILICPPTRSNTNITMGLCINWGQICISANWNRNAMTSVDCEAFLRIYADAMREWLQTGKQEVIPSQWHQHRRMRHGRVWGK